MCDLPFLTSNHFSDTNINEQRGKHMTNSYQSFAYVYDTFMDNIPYDEWSSYLLKLLHQHNIMEGTLIELGCGTATMALHMADAGFQVLGVDISQDMLTIASSKIENSSQITLILQDMCELDLDLEVPGIYCICDSLNYLLTEDEILKTFQAVKKHLTPDGTFIFDLKTEYFYRDVLGDQVFCDHQENCSYTWENSFFEEDNINQYDLTIFAKSADSELFERFTETHHQRAYSHAKIVDLLKQAGLQYETSYDAFTENAPHEKSERIYFIARNGDMIHE